MALERLTQITEVGIQSGITLRNVNVEGAYVSGVVTATSLNITSAGANFTGVVTATSFVGNVTGNINSTGVSTFSSGPVIIGTSSSTGTASQRLQVSGGAYVSDNLGIGTTNPGTKLHVFGNSTFYTSGSPNTQSAKFDGASGTYTTWLYNGTPVGDLGTGNVTVSVGATTDFAITSRNSSLIFGTNTTERARINSSGNLGIGSTSPNSKLDVVGSVLINNSVAAYTASNTTEANNSNMPFRIGPTRSGLSNMISIGHINFGNGGTSASAIQALDTSTNTASTLYLNPLNANSTGVVAVGSTLCVGTLDNFSLLNVHGIPSAATEGYALIHIRDTQTTSGATGRGGIWIGSAPGTDYFIAKTFDKTLSATRLSFGNGNTGDEFMGLSQSGKLGIGTVNPSEDLHIFSSSGAIKIDSTGDSAIRWAQNGSSKFSLYQSGGTLRFYDNTNSTERVRLDSTGNLLLQTFSTNFGLTNGVITGDGNTTIGSGGRQKFAFIANGYSTGAGLPHFIGNWASSGQWGAGPHSGSADNTIRIGPATYDSNGFYWNTGSQGGYANLAINALYLRANTTAQRDALSGVAAGSVVYNSDSGLQVYNGSSWITYATASAALGTSGNPASNGVALWDAGFRDSGLYYISTSNGGTKQVWVDLDPLSNDDASGKAGWMLVGSWNAAASWQQQAATQSSVFGSAARDCFSSNFGDTTVKWVRIKVGDNILGGPQGSVGDFYFYKSAGASWKRWWTSDGTTPYLSTTVNGGTSTPRNSLISFDYAYNLKYGYKASTQVWNNLSDNSGVQGNWDTGLTTAGTSIGYYNAGDGSFGIIPSGDTSTGAGHDCNVNNAKFGYDDTTTCYDGGTSATYNMNTNNSNISGHNQKLWLWVK